jgi:hypothetical protein
VTIERGATEAAEQTPTEGGEGRLELAREGPYKEAKKV